MACWLCCLRSPPHCAAWYRLVNVSVVVHLVALPFGESMSSKNCKVICWNVRGLNDGAKRASVHNQIISSEATIVCLQETKIEVWSRTLLLETLRADMVDNVVFFAFGRHEWGCADSRI